MSSDIQLSNIFTEIHGYFGKLKISNLDFKGIKRQICTATYQEVQADEEFSTESHLQTDPFILLG